MQGQTDAAAGDGEHPQGTRSGGVDDPTVPSGGNAAKSAVQLRNGSGWHRWNPPGKGRLLRGVGQIRAKGPIRLVLPRIRAELPSSPSSTAAAMTRATASSKRSSRP